ncbi:MAG: threonine ammonia-lyase [Chloroflexi bacterium]|uniref:L-threonine dehydratase catabolic TdcB n=1 Tax=Candidatus Chlorohelix allophototropha TaxID=3003348 RepID=A0A8T7M2W2_9CHLR|nr:threonine ammonia-lyase [Chloroflexota bacterium]WJW66866.1 threonine ammonia-lyase [Chloroflexota bacterium L227-S17]
MTASTEIPVKLETILEAAGRISGVVRRTDLMESQAFSKECGATVFLKFENMQRTGSFKIRGAYNKISRLAEMRGDERPLGIICVSAGNHAQGVASAALFSGFAATVVMPLGASLTKVMACRDLKAEVIQHGNTLEEAFTFANELAKARELMMVHPYDDWDVIAGQGTIGLEVLQDLHDVNTVVAPLGGGGLLSGIALAIKLQKPEVRVIGVQTEAVSPYYGFIQSGKYSAINPDATTIADGIRVKLPGERPSLVLRRYVDDVVTVDDGKISEAIVSVLERTRTLVEGAGAIGLAALMAGKIPLKQDERVAVILSGGNIDTPLVGNIIDYGLSSSGRLFAVSILLTDKPGQLHNLLRLVAEMGMNLRQVQHRRGELNVPVGRTEVVLQIECRAREQHSQLVEHLRNNGLEARIIN